MIRPKFDDLLRINPPPPPPPPMFDDGGGGPVLRPGVSGGEMSPVELPESLLDFCVRSIRLMLFSVCVRLPKPTLVPWNPDCC